MKHKKLIAIAMCAAVSLTGLLSGCSGCSKSDTTAIKMSYYDESAYKADAELSDINENIFYRNELVFGETVQGADPAVMQITDPNDPDCGKFVLTATWGNYSFACWLSADLVHWEPKGLIMQADKDNNSDLSKVMYANTWAAEMIYDNGKYYLFFSATPRNDPDITGYENPNSVFGKEYACIPYVAVADSWKGPFELIDNSAEYKYADGTPMTQSKAAAENIGENNYAITDNAQGYAYFLKYSLFDPYKMWKAISESDDPFVKEIETYEYTKILRAIDLHPFADGDKKYMYFTVNKDGDFSSNKNTYCAVMKMNSWTEPDYSTFRTLTRYGLYELGGTEATTYENKNEHINEGAWMTKHNGKYYLTLSVNGYATSYYKVIQAVSDSPMGPFRKLTEAEGGVVLGADSIQDVGGPGHHAIVEVNGELYIVYHKVDDYQNPTHKRHVAMNKLEWVSIKDKDGKDLDVMYAAGPTTKALTVLPEFATGYKNVAPQATVSATNLVEGSSEKSLNDKLIPIRTGVNAQFMTNYVKEAEFKGETTIKLTFEDYVNINAIMIYNSMKIQNAFYDVERVEFKYKDGGNDKVKFIEHLAFDWRGLSNGYHAEWSPTGNNLKTGAAAIAEFNEIAVKEIIVTVKPATEEQIDWHDSDMAAQLAIGEIVVLSKTKS